MCLKEPPTCSHQQSLNDGVSVLALVVHHFDVVQVSVGPVHQPVDQVQRDAVREDDLAVHQLSTVLPIHVAALHLGDLPIVSKEHLPAAKEQKGDLRSLRTCQFSTNTDWNFSVD